MADFPENQWLHNYWFVCYSNEWRVPGWQNIYGYIRTTFLKFSEIFLHYVHFCVHFCAHFCVHFCVHFLSNCIYPIESIVWSFIWDWFSIKFAFVLRGGDTFTRRIQVLLLFIGVFDSFPLSSHLRRMPQQKMQQMMPRGMWVALILINILINIFINILISVTLNVI